MFKYSSDEEEQRNKRVKMTQAETNHKRVLPFPLYSISNTQTEMFWAKYTPY